MTGPPGTGADAATVRLSVDVRHRFGDFQLDARFTGRAGVTALFGRSGSGKTSLVNVIAGLVRPQHGRIDVDGRVLVDTAAGLFVPRHRRRIGYVFQEARLFPHLGVRGNLLYGCWFAGGPRRRDDFDRVVAMLGVGHLLDRRPAALSGGERQRVAIGRALLSAPQILLMDEPLASLDQARKAEILPYIERLRDEAGVPIVYVSHAIDEGARLAGTVVLLGEGRVLVPDDGYGLAILATAAGGVSVPAAGLAADGPGRHPRRRPGGGPRTVGGGCGRCADGGAGRPPRPRTGDPGRPARP